MREILFISWVESMYNLKENNIVIISELRRDKFVTIKGKNYSINWHNESPSCYLINNNETGNVDFFVITIPKEDGLTLNQFELTVLHELGHVFNNRDDVELLSGEVDAWNWAISEAEKNLVHVDMRYIKDCLRSHIDDHRIGQLK